jgi:MFS transporter, ACS family, D-galactonate transporter
MRLKKTPRNAWLVLGCAWLLGFIMYSGILCIPPMQHIIQAELALSHAQMGLIFSMPLLVLVAIAIPSGWLADRIGIRTAAGIGAIVITAASFLRGVFSSDFETLLALTALYGAGFALIYPNLPKLVAAWFPLEKIGLATGIYTTGLCLGFAVPFTITLPVVFPVTNTFQGVFYIWAIPALVATILWWIIVREPPPVDKSMIAGQVAGEGNDSLSQPLWKNKNIWLVAVIFFFNDVHMYTWSDWTPTLLQAKGAPEDLAAVIASVMLWVSIPVLLLAPWGSYRVGLRKPFLWGSAIVLIVSSLAAVFAPLSASWLLMVAVGIGTNVAFPILLALPVEMVPKQFVGRASGMILSIAYIGGFIGPLLAGHILDITGNLDPVFFALAGVALAWTIVSFLIPETGKKARLKSS